MRAMPANKVLGCASLTYSAESAASPSGSSEPECEQSPSAKSTHTADESSQSTGQACPATETSANSATRQQQMLFAADSPVRTSALRGEVPDWPAIAAAYGQSSPELLAKYDPASQSWKTFQCSWVEDLDKFSETWPRSGMTRSGTAYRLPPLVPLTDATESGLLPTPVAIDTGSRMNRSASAGAKLRPTLGAMAKFGLWPTPTTVTGHNAGRLDEWGGARSRRMISHLPKNERSGPLSPTFPEWLMGYPIGYTDCGPSETPSSRGSQKRSGGPS
jgi:hypothetical protein